jgi:hypothetical protein
MGKSAEKLLNIESDLSKEFLENKYNQELLREAANGNTAALKALQKAAAEDIFKGLGDEGVAAFADLKDEIDQVLSADIAVGVTIDTSDTTGLYDYITEIYNSAV